MNKTYIKPNIEIIEFDNWLENEFNKYEFIEQDNDSGE